MGLRCRRRWERRLRSCEFQLRSREAGIEDEEERDDGSCTIHSRLYTYAGGYTVR